MITSDGKVDDGYINQLALSASSRLYPNEQANYSWKRLDGYLKESKFEVGSGQIQGFNGQQRVFLSYRQLQVREKSVIVGYVFGMARSKEDKLLFEQNLGGDSMPAQYAQMHIIASITDEKYDELYRTFGVPGGVPGGVVITSPTPKR